MNESLKETLEKYGLSEYIVLFEQHKILDTDALSDLNENELEKIGINAIGDRKKIIKLFGFASQKIDTKLQVSDQKEDRKKPSVGGSFFYAILFEIIMNIIFKILGEGNSINFSLGIEITLWTIELVIITGVIHIFRKWRWESKN